MPGVFYVLRLQEPVLANGFGGDTNSARTLSCIPGSVFRGAVIGAYQQQQPRAELDAEDPDIRRLFFNGATRYLHAYPFIDAARALPAPLSWRKIKGEQAKQHRVYDLSIALAATDEQLTGLGEGAYCVLIGQTAYTLARQEQLNVHTQRDAERGRATTEHGAVFRYEALAAGTRLAGYILTATEDDAEQIEVLLQGRTLFFGKARTAGYGRAHVESVERLTDDAWREAGLSGGSLASDSTFTLTLLSDVIVRDDRGQYTLDPLPALRQRCGNGFELTAGEDMIFRQTEVVGGFNRKWGLPLPQVTAIAAGSVFVITATPAIPEAILRQLEAEGIGERRVEGFGRIAINWHALSEDYLPLAELTWATLEPEAADLTTDGAQPPLHQIQLSEDESRFARQLLTRIIRHDLDRQLLDAVQTSSIHSAEPIPNSQLSRWRALIRSALTEPSPARRIGRLTEFLAHEEHKKSAAWESMWRARVRFGDADSGERLRLTEWTQQVLTDQQSPWKWFKNSRKPQPYQLGEALQVAVDTALTIEYRLRLLDGVLARKAKEQAEGAKRGGGND